MIEIAVQGRGGRGGVTLAKLIAGAYFLRGRHVQAFGVYGAERTGAPVQAFVRIDEQPVTLHGAIQAPDHVVVLDPSLAGPEVLRSADPDGWLIINSPGTPEALAAAFPGRAVATVDASAIAIANGLGTRTVPIVNTAMLGAVMKVLGMSCEDAEAALAHAGFAGGNTAAAALAFEQVRSARLAGTWTPASPRRVPPALSLLDEAVGGPPDTRTGSWASRQPRDRELTAPCGFGCPAGHDVRGFVQAAARGEDDEALAIILATSPFPGVCGRVCPAPCMASCNRGALDEPVNVREIERAVERRARRPLARRPAKTERVAVVGSGPAGLTAAYHLARLGYCVHIYEKDDELGGVLRTGIPSYRLPRATLDREIAYIMAHGVVAEMGRAVDAEQLERLRAQFSAVLVATGLQSARSLDLAADSRCDVLQGLAFLDAARRGGIRLDDRRVVVVGGGNTAIDSARTALRLGAREVCVAYRRTRAEMPAISEEIDEALDEGVELCELISPVRLQDDAGASVLACRRMTLGEVDEAGRRMVSAAGDDLAVPLPCDLLVLAIGQDDDRMLTSAPERRDGQPSAENLGPVLFCGDVAVNDGTVAAAIGSGRAAALRVHSLFGENVESGVTGGPIGAKGLAGPETVDLHAFALAAQLRAALLPASERRRTFDEVRGELEEVEGPDGVTAEAGRCFSCGSCSACRLCLEYCPEGVVRVAAGGLFDADDEYCKGCGLCASICPRGALSMCEIGTMEEVLA